MALKSIIIKAAVKEGQLIFVVVDLQYGVSALVDKQTFSLWVLLGI